MSSHNEPYVTTFIAPEGKKVLKSELIEQFAGQISNQTRMDWLNEGVACDLYHAVEKPVFDTNEPLDIFTQPVENRKKKLLISDMDSTLIEQECIDELAAYLGIKERIAVITEKAMNGELEFESALRARVALLKGLPESALQEVYDTRITLMPGAKTLAATMKANGATLLLVSGGFTFFTARIRDALGFDEDRSNQLEIVDGALTGAVIDPILGQEAKRQALDETRSKLGIDAAHCLAVGDGANDVAMLQAAGLGVAYHAKAFVQQQVNASIRHNDLSALLYVQGYKRREWMDSAISS